MSTRTAARLLSLVIGVPAALTALIVSSATAASLAVVNDDAVAVHSNPSVRSKKLASLARGQRVSIQMSLRQGDTEWCEIVTWEQALTTGFARCSQLQPLPANQVAWFLAYDTAQHARQQGRYAEAEAAFRAAIDEAEALGPRDPKLGVSLNELQKLLIEQGKYREAEPVWERLLVFMERFAGRHSPMLAQTLVAMAGFYSNGGKPDEAKRHLDRALAIQERALGPKHPDVAATLEDLTRWYRDAGRYGEAEAAARRALEVREHAFGPQHPAVAASLTNLAMLLRDRGKRAEARTLLVRGLAIQEKTLGPDSSDLGVTLTYLADIAAAEGQYRDAERTYRRALAIYGKSLGQEHLYVGATMMALASVVHSGGNHQTADALYREGLAILEKRMGPRNPNLAGHLNQYVIFLKAVNREGDAQPIEARIDDLKKQGRN